MFDWLKRRKVEPVIEAPALPDGGFETLFGPIGKRFVDGPTGVQTVAIVGNCVAQTLAEGLKSSAVLTDMFRFVPVPVHLMKLTDPEAREILATASHVFLQSNAASQRLEIKQVANRDADIVLYPDIVLRSLWPFDAMSGYADDAVVDTPTAVLRHPDGVLARLRTVEPDKDKRFALYRDLAFEEARTVARIAAAQEKFFTLIDEDTGAGLGAFLQAGFKDPSGAVFQMLATFVWKRLDMAGRPPVFSGMDGWKMWSVPVHPGVARLQGVGWATERTRYSYTTMGEVTWEQWVRAYIDMLG
jgi:hypothetical protein